MKFKNFLCTVAVALMALAAKKAIAFPLNLTAVSGTITSTADFGNTTNNKVKVVAVNLKTILTVVSNEISIRTSGTNAPPLNSRIAYDPYQYQVYVTNNNGYFYDITRRYTGPSDGFVTVQIDDMATTLREVALNGVVESDVIAIYLDIVGHGTDGLSYEFGIYGRGKLAYSLNGRTGRGTMAITATGTAYGEYKDTDDGVATGSAVFSGSGTPEWEGAYSIFWWNN